MKRIKFILVTLLLVAAFIRCQKDIIVKDIKNEFVTVLSPPDGFKTPNNSITFWWEKIDGAEKYNVQIVSPSFSSIQQLISDTSVTGDKFVKTLQPGTYQWRVRATNNGGSTPWATRTLTIDTSSNLAFSSVILASPVDSFYTNATSVNLSWYSVSNASLYTLTILGVIGNTNYSTTSATVSFPTEGSFTWSVRAENSFSFSPYSSRKIIIDRTAPSAPALTYPSTNANNIATNDTLRWTTATGSNKDVIFISTAADFSNTIKLDTVSEVSNGIRRYLINNISSPTGTYYWKVKSVDKAGNVGNYSTAFNFSVQ
ncbi:MAG TPA: hypothetical protein VGF30_13975 [Bacteroidia bacterium]